MRERSFGRPFIIPDSHGYADMAAAISRGRVTQEKDGDAVQSESDSRVTNYPDRHTRFLYVPYDRAMDTETERGIDSPAEKIRVEEPVPALVGATTNDVAATEPVSFDTMQTQATTDYQSRRSRASQVQPHVVKRFFDNVNIVPRQTRPSPVEKAVFHAAPSTTVEIPKKPSLWGRYRHQGRHRR